MARMEPMELLPEHLLRRVTMSGLEYSWRLEDIPEVIEAARSANLVNIGGQLQFHFPDGDCECYWVEVDTYRTVPKHLPWGERVERTAMAALSEFRELPVKYDMIIEGRKAFWKYFDQCEAAGFSPRDAMRFIWYATTEEEAKWKGL